MRNLLYILIIPLILFSCSGIPEREVKHSKDKEGVCCTDDTAWEGLVESEFEDQEHLSNYQEHYWKSKIISSSLRNGLELTNNYWEDPIYFLCSEKERFLSVKEVADSCYIAISVDDSHNFFFYDIKYVNEEVLVRIQTKTKIENADYELSDRFNLIKEYSIIYYVRNDAENNVYCYDLNLKKHKTSPFVWKEIRSKQKNNIHYSNDKSQSVTIAETALILNKKDTLISQEYDGSWSFQDVSWGMSNDKVYFDNSGAVACIWEINLKKRTLDKVVPEHMASSPIVIYENGDSITFLYCEEHCIKMISNFKSID